MVNDAVSFESRGERCVASWYRPEGAAARWPSVVFANGFSGTRDWILPDFAQRFAGAGFAALTFDDRHHGAREPRGRGWTCAGNAPICARP
jgi:uncharacterized protein